MTNIPDYLRNEPPLTVTKAANGVTISADVKYSEGLRYGTKAPEVKKSWFRCPHCGKALFPLREDTKIQNMPFRCKACKHDIEVNID